jgi:hypothetical protein
MERDAKGRFVKKNVAPTKEAPKRDAKGRFVSKKGINDSAVAHATMCSVAYYWFNVFTSCSESIVNILDDSQREALLKGCELIKSAFTDYACKCAETKPTDTKPARDEKGRFIKKDDKCSKKK